MSLIFGQLLPGIQYTERRSAYVVILSEDGRVAMVKAGQKHFLPGGGSEPGEAPEETIPREVREELGRSVRLIRCIGTAIQYFYSPSDDRHYKMRATFFRGEFTDEPPSATGEHELEWLSVDEAEDACFHDCHAWAIKHP